VLSDSKILHAYSLLARNLKGLGLDGEGVFSEGLETPYKAILQAESLSQAYRLGFLEKSPLERPVQLENIF
jgi:hypothetical protein